MSTPTESFFSKAENQAVMRRFEMVLKSTPFVQELDADIINLLARFFKIAVDSADAFNQHCTTNIDWIGNGFMRLLEECVELQPTERSSTLVSIFTSAYRFLCELEFSQSADLSFTLRDMKVFVENNLERFTFRDRAQLVYASFVMPASIAKRLIHSPALMEFKSFADTANEAKKLKISWDKELHDKNAEMETLRDGIEQVKTTYNFVGLVKGFEAMTIAKETERGRSFRALMFLGFFMIAPVVTQLWFIAIYINATNLIKDTLIYLVPSFLALEIILIYFFRVVFFNFRSVTTQLLQLNLRISLCQFIQSYSEYSMKIKKQDAGALEKFESLIFSSIASGGEALPSTFDGFDQIAKLVNDIRNK